MVMPDHVPYHKDPVAGWQSFAFCYGYIKGLIQAVTEEAEAAS
jgi:mannonate dehydratase